MGPTNQDATKILLGSTGSSEKEVTYEPGDPSVCKPGLAVSRDLNGALSLGGAAGSFLGVSVGKSLSDIDKCAVARTGLRVPMKLQDDNVFSALTKNELTFTSKLRGVEGDDISITFVDQGAGAVTVEVDGLDIVVNMDDTSMTGSTASAIKAAIEASEDANALIGVTVADGEDDTVQDDFTIDNLEGGTDAFAWVVVGAAVEVDGDTGEACENDEATGGFYASGVLNAIDSETGLQDGYAALVDMTGGL